MVKFRKKAPFTCRTPDHFSVPPTDSDGDCCPACTEARKVLAVKSAAPILRADDVAPQPSGRFMTVVEEDEKKKGGS